jgi:hypothetical protein
MCYGKIFMTADPGDPWPDGPHTRFLRIPEWWCNSMFLMSLSCICVMQMKLYVSWCLIYIYIYLFIYSIYMHVVFYIWVDCQPHVFIRSKHFWMPKIGHLEAIKSAAPWKFHPLCLWTIPFWIVAYEISIKSPLKSPYYMDFHLKSYFLWK